jgi:hypothetical protein
MALEELPDNPAMQASPTPADTGQRKDADLTQPENTNSEPTGTAVAPYRTPVGSMASRPAGAAIAPAKQRRVRSILIRVGLIGGAGVAVGSVVALSHGSPARP